MLIHHVPQDTASLKPATNHLLIAFDCSGSMSGELPHIRRHLKDNLPTLVRPGDRVSFVWFSGKGECGRLVNAKLIEGLETLAELNESIDRWLAPVGLTGFQAPVELLLDTVNTCRARTDWQGSQSVQFLSDGHDNQSSRQDVLKACTLLGQVVDHAVVVEYGHYADRRLLSEMAAALGGTLSFAPDFQGYRPELDAFMSRPPGQPRRTVSLGQALAETGTLEDALALAVVDGEILLFTPDDHGEVRVPGDVTRLTLISSGMTAEALDEETLRSDDGALIYAAISVAAARMDGALTETLLQASGDARLLALYRTVLGKQRFAAFSEEAKLTALDPKKRLVQGQDFGIDLNADTLSVLEVIELLSTDPAARLQLGDPAFRYSRIGPARVTAEGATTAEQHRIKALSEQVASGKGDDGGKIDPETLLNLQAQLLEIQTRIQAAPKFTPEQEGGLAIDALVWNKELPNLSVRTHRDGYVTFENVPGGLTLPAQIPTRTVRAYTVVKDGLVNIGTLPVQIGRASYQRLTERGLTLPEWNPDATYLLPLDTLPVISRAAAAKASLSDMIDASAQMISLQGSLRVYNEYLRRAFPPASSEGLSERYGKEAAAFLRKMGVTDHGYNPPSNEVKTGDVRPVTEFKVALKGLSTLPKVSDVEEKLALDKTLTPVMSLLAPAIKANASFLQDAADLAEPEEEQAARYRAWLQGQIDEGEKRLKALEFRTARVKFGLIAGQRWFTDSSGPADNARAVTVLPGLLPGETDRSAIQTIGTAELKDKELQI